LEEIRVDLDRRAVKKKRAIKVCKPKCTLPEVTKNARCIRLGR